MRTPENNLRLLHNLVDWAIADTGLLSIRASRTAANLNVEVDSQGKWEWGNYALAFLGLLLVVSLSRVMPKPTIDLASARKLTGKGRKTDKAAKADKTAKTDKTDEAAKADKTEDTGAKATKKSDNANDDKEAV
jgi:hypothetical protein